MNLLTGRSMPPAIVVLLYFFFANPAYCQSRVECNSITEHMGFTVKSVIIKSRWVSKELQDTIEKIVGVGKPFSQRGLTAAQQIIANELSMDRLSFRFSMLMGSTSVLYITTGVCDVSNLGGPRELQIIIRAYYLGIDLVNTGTNILPIAHSPSPTFYKRVPKTIIVTSPAVGFTSDRRYGPALFLQTNTDLLHPVGLAAPAVGSKLFRLDLALNARKSLNDAFYTVGAGLNFSHPVYAGNMFGWNLGVYYDQKLQPLGIGEYKRKFTQVYGAIQGSLNRNPVSKYVLGGNLNFLQNYYTSLPGKDAQNTENNYGFFATGDGKIGKGFSRLGLWFESGVAGGKTNVTKYQKMAGRIAYAISLGQGHNNFDLETMLGSGYIWGEPLSYSQFYAGNTSWNFLYEPVNSIRNHSMPDGPVLRSLGERQGTLNTATNTIAGGNFYWHFNLSLAIPVAKWSQPVIPDIVVNEVTHSTLATVLKGQVNAAKNWIIEDLIKNGAPDNDSTDAKAEKIVGKDIRPTINYLADKANAYSFKPILLFDAAQMTDRVLPGKTWIGAGIGVQLSVVSARLELGYIRNLIPASAASGGNFLIRLTLQDFY